MTSERDGTQPASTFATVDSEQLAATASWRCVSPTASRCARSRRASASGLVIIVVMHVTMSEGHRTTRSQKRVNRATPHDDALQGVRSEILEAERIGRPTFAIAGLVVPRLELVPVAVEYGDGHAYVPPAEAFAPRKLPLSNGQQRACRAAILHDLHGMSHVGLCEELQYEWPDTAKKTVKKGRKLLAGLAAWPWWALNPQGGPLPDQWWTEPYVTETFAVWRQPPR
jgi:hypothetical protein